MATLQHPKDFLYLLRCACSESARLTWRAPHVVCSNCGRSYEIRENILDLLDPGSLDIVTRRELEGNTIPTDQDTLINIAHKDTWSPFVAHLSKRKIDRLAGYLDRVDWTRLISLGSGAGFEIRELLKLEKRRGKRNLSAAYCSDLSFSLLSATPYALEEFEIGLGRFTSTLDACPVVETTIPILVYEALHHTLDMHAAIERLLAAGHRNVFLVEPTDNRLMRRLAKREWTQRVEYSGVKPGRLDIKRLRALCKKHGYAFSVTTRWDFPEDYFLRYFGRSALARRAFTAFLDFLSVATSLFHFGNTAIVHLRKP